MKQDNDSSTFTKHIKGEKSAPTFRHARKSERAPSLNLALTLLVIYNPFREGCIVRHTKNVSFFLNIKVNYKYYLFFRGYVLRVCI